MRRTSFCTEILVLSMGFLLIYQRLGLRTAAAAASLATTIAAASLAMSQDQAFRVTVARATSVDYAPHISAFGFVRPDPTRVSTLVSLVGGVVQRVNTRPGESISKGDTPVTLLTDPAAQTEVAQTRDAIRLADETLRRVQPLFEKGLVQKSEVDNAQRDLADSQARLENLRKTGALDPEVSPAAPADGVVTDVLVQVGDQIVAGSALVRAADPAALAIRIGVEAADLDALPIGTPVQVTAITGLEAGDPSPPSTSSTVSAVQRIVDPQTRLVPVFAMVAGAAADGFLINQAVKARFQLDKVPATKIPHAALLYQGESPTVFVVRNGKAVRREVSLIEVTDDWVYLDGGVGDGETVVTSGQAGLSDGASVRTAP